MKRSLLILSILFASTILLPSCDKGEDIEIPTSLFKVIFETNGGSEIASLTLEQGSTVDCPTPPTKDGHIFEDWYSNAYLTKLYDFSSQLTTDLTLYAKWEVDPIIYDMEISTVEELIAFGNAVNGGASTLKAILLGDLDLSVVDANGDSWQPIGINDSLCFSGIFSGGGYTISNLTITSDDDCQGLFGYVSGGSIINLTLARPQIHGGYRTGAICGYLSSGSIFSCSVNDGYVEGLSSVGGVVGYATSFAITSCYNRSLVWGADSYVGGIVGYATSTAYPITSCYNTGAVSGGGYYVGGVVGYANSASLSSCYNMGEVSGSADDVGGIVGFSASSSVVRLCYNLGAVSGVGSDVGGIVGSSCSSLVSCYNVGEVSGGGSSVGGIVGYAVAASSSLVSCYNVGEVSGCYNVGGVVGTPSSSPVTSCYYMGGSYGSGTGVRSIAELNSAVADMNQAAGDNHFMVNGLSTLPSLFGEEIAYEGRTIDYVESMTISSVADLKRFRDHTNAGWGAATVTLTADLNLEGESWTPIVNFYGIFKGGGHTISNLTITSDDDYHGLFGSVNGGTIQNLTLESPQIKGGHYTGAVCGLLYSGSILGCGVKGGSVEGSGNCVGGVVGSVNSAHSPISSCYNTGEVMGGGYYVGGVVGWASSSLISCYNLGAVRSAGSHVGGIVGYASSSSLTSCYSRGSICGAGSYVGGIVGSVNSAFSPITSCYNTGEVTGEGYYVGGVVGWASSAIISCYNLGVVRGAGSHVGGVVGRAYSFYSTVTDSYYLPVMGRSYVNSHGTASSQLEEIMTSFDFVLTLNTAAGSSHIRYDRDHINGGYPIFTWQ